MRNMDRISMEGAVVLLLFLLSSLHFHKIYSSELYTISDSRFLTDGDTLVSSTGIFELGFFRPGSSENRYIGIWYKKVSVRTVVWVANRNHPITGASSNVLRISDAGILVLVNNISDIVWSSNTTSSGNVSAHLQDTGNLVVTDENNNNKILWQSFDYPTDTILPEMKFGKNFLTGKDWSISSWKSNDDPSPGEYTWAIGTGGYPQHLLKQGAVVKFRGGPWNGVRFSGDTKAPTSNIFTFEMVMNETEEVYSFTLIDKSILIRLILLPIGITQRYVWIEDNKKWQHVFTLPQDGCDQYAICGPNGMCSTTSSPPCVCLDKTRFVPRNEKGWGTADWSDGCVRRTPLDCKNGSDGFVAYENIKLPDTQKSWFNLSMTLKECEAMCLKNCTCMAYANTDIRGAGSGCLLWFNDLLDIKSIVNEGGGSQLIYVRMAFSELDKKKVGSHIKIILPVLFLGILFIVVSLTWFCYTRRRRNDAQPMGKGGSVHVPGSKEDEEATELPLFSFSTIANATERFSPANKLGEGGFGSVYKGMLEDGKEIAVKRLSKDSSQGLDEFKNEVICISKLQHRNLVKLLGCCIQGEERLLIYEYMPNRSLDSFIFDKMQGALADWTMRFNIIKGIARGLLYLHQDSRLRIIHRDLKASNVLLDQDMTPKISDFGIARSFGGNETQANTDRVVGTYGYMSPEYALYGLFSIKSDVFSFGVLVLEIVSGKRNRGSINMDHANSLIGHAWSIHNEGRSMELIDENLVEACNPSEVLRSITVGLLCVQESAEDRPDMSSVILMLGDDCALVQPKQPAFFMERELYATNDHSSSSTYRASSINDLTITEVDAR